MKKLTTLFLIMILRISYLLTAIAEKILGSIKCVLGCVALTVFMLFSKRPKKCAKLSYCIN